MSTANLLVFLNATISAVTMTTNGTLWTFAQAMSPTVFIPVPILGDLASPMRWLWLTVTMSMQIATNQQSITWTMGYLSVFTYFHMATVLTSLASASLERTIPSVI